MSNIYAFLLAALPALLNLGILFYLIFFLPKGKTNTLFAFFVVALLLWQFEDGAARLIPTENDMQFWDRMFSIGWIMLAPLLFNFTALYTSSKKLTSRSALILLYAPFIILYALYVSNGHEVNFQFHNFWGWLAQPRPGTTDLFQRQFISVIVIAALALLFRYSMQQKHSRQKRNQALIIAIGILIPTVQGTVTQIIFPIFIGIDIPLTSAFMTFLSLATILAFKKYHLFEVSESLQVEEILQNISNIVLIITPNGKINYLNPFAQRNLNLSSNDDVFLEDIFQANKSFHTDFKNNIFSKCLTGKTITAFETCFFTEQGTVIHVTLNAEPILNNHIIQGVLVVATDITARKNSEDRLRSAKERYEAVVKSTSDAIWDLDIELGKTYIVGMGHKQLFGHDVMEGYAPDNYWESRLHPADRERAINEKQNALKTLSTEQGFSEYRFLKADGSYADILDRFAIIHKGKTPIHMIGAMQDITARKQNERVQALEKKIYKLNSDTEIPLSEVLNKLSLQVEDLLPESHCSILISNDSNKLKHIAGSSMPESYIQALYNESDENFSGSCSAAIYREKTSIVSDITEDPLWQQYLAVAQPFGFKACWSAPIKKSSGESIGCFAIYHKQKRAAGSIHVLLLERMAALIGVVIENRTAVEEIKTAKDRYDIVAKATSDTIWDMDIAKDKIKYNQGIQTMFGYQKKQIQNTGKWMAEKIYPEDLKRIKEEVQQTFESAGSTIKMEYRFLCANGAYKHVLDRAYISYGENGKPSRIIGAMQDITERKTHLEAIEEQNRKLRDIAFIQSHVVRAPLARILGLAGILKLSDIKKEEIFEIVENMVVSAHELDDVIREIVDKTVDPQTQEKLRETENKPKNYD